ncbi:Ankyrin repeat-containing domain protein [Rhypophila sp. PSN 637]
MSSPALTASKASPGASRIGRPPQWTISRSRKLARLYVYTTLSIEKIIRVLEDDVFKPRKNSAQKTIHKMLDNDPRYLRPDSRIEMNQRIGSLASSPARTQSRQKSPFFGSQFHDTGLHTSRGWVSHTPITPQPANPDHLKEEPDLSGLGTTSTSSPRSFALDSPSLRPSLGSQYGITEGLRNLSTAERMVDAAKSPDNSQFSVQQIRRRVSDCSMTYASQISTLLKRLSISSELDGDDDEGQSGRISPFGLAEVRGLSGNEPNREMGPRLNKSGYALPGDYLGAYRWHCTDPSDPDHAIGRCWCFVTREMTSTPDAWFLPNGQLSDRAKMALSDPAQANIFPSDHFGNTALHLFASLAGYWEVLFGMLLHGADARAVDTGRQTFLHVLHEEWFVNLSTPSAPLRQLLAFLQHLAPDLVYERDAYGRTFFHHAFSVAGNDEELVVLLSSLHPANQVRRDAFGFAPSFNDQFGDANIPPRAGVSEYGVNAGPADHRQGESRPSSADDVSFLAYHARLVQVIQSSYNDAQVEDSEGRNGLHCLAEAIINQQTMDEQRSVMTAGRASKRKESISVPTPSNAEGTLLARLRHLEGLTIHSTHPVDINHYDKYGNTVLMAFITHISDDQDDKSKTLVSILETLIRAGARIEARNRLGETALLVAARLGRKAALTTLLENGANVYARDTRGRGILEVVDETCRAAKADVALYARLEACRVLLTGRRDWGVVFRPSMVMEWSLRGSGHSS